MATTSLGRLTLDLVAQIGQFVEPLNKAERKARDSAKSIAKEFDVATIAVKALSAAAAGISVASVMNFASEFINSATEIDRSAKLVGASTQQFQYFAAGAKVAGISLEKFADINKDVNDRLGEARRGEGEMMDFFTKIAPRVGITIDQFKKLSGPEALQLYYNGLQKANLSHAEQITYMEQIANDAGLLIPMLKDGGAGFKEWGDQAQKAGTIMSDELMVQLITAKENLQILDLKWQGLKATLVNDVMPSITYVSNNLDTVKAVALGLGAAIATKVVFQIGMLSFEFAKGVAQGVAYQVALAGVQGQSIRTATAMGVLKAISSTLGGPLGIGLLVAQGAAAYATFKYMKSGSDDLTGKLNTQALSVKELTKQYDQLSISQKQAFIFEESKKLAEVTKDYKEAKENFYLSAVGIAYDGADTTEAKTQIDNLVKSFRNGSITALQFVDAMAKMGIYSKEQISTAVKFATENDNVKKSLDNQRKAVEALSGRADKLTEAHTKTTEAVKAQKDAYADLSEKQKQALMEIDKEITKRKYIENFVKAGGTREKAEYFYDYRDRAGVNGTGKALTPIEISKANQGFSLNNYSLDANDRKKIAGAMAYAVKNNIEDLAKAGGIPQNLLTGLLATESGGKNLTSPTGATGHWQTTSAFREQHAKILKAGNYSETAFTQAVIKDLQDNYKKFGNWPDAIMAYNGGAGGVDAFKAGRVSDKVKTQGGYQKIGGVGYLSPAKYEEMKTHQERTLKYASGAGGSSKIDPSIAMPSTDDLLKLQNDAVQVKKSLDDAKAAFEKQLATPLKQMDIENSETIKKLQETYADDPKKLKEMLDKNDVLYQANRNKLIAEKQNEYNQYFSFEKDRITQVIDNYDYEISKIKENTDYSISDRKKMAEAKEREKQAEIASIKLEQKEQILSANEAYMSETEAMLRRYEIEREQIKLNKSQLGEMVSQQLLEANSMAVYQVMERNRAAIADAQQEALASRFMRNNSGNYGQFDGSYQQWDMQNAYGFASGGIDQAYNDQVSGINLIEDDEQRKQQLLEAEQRYLEAKKALNDEYNEQERDARNAMQADNIATYGAMFGGMADLVKGYAGESSGAYRTMIAAQKAANLASAIMSGYTSIAAAWGSKPFPYNLPAVAIATAKAGVFQAAIQAVTPGFYDGGYTGHGGKYDPAGIVHKGEGVLTQEEIAALGGPAGFEYLRKAIRTGDLFNNSEILASKSFMEMAGYSDGGIVGGGDVRLSGYSISPQQSTISSKPSATTTGGDVTIQVNVTDSGVNTSGGNTQDQRQFAQVVGNAVRAVIIQEKRQGGLLSK
ncbi:transglycosylase SLT domain-containing protein [Acinetobacter bereziniae]|uniref:transglycosylase SLT domain-containing protein n=1 Tax=Acinetobacter bereziniae TaxID=106648 RepID=UPI0015DA0802|nr:transglycosylase SLT domain-containing protein [Acinetobacter bereziniae]